MCVFFAFLFYLRACVRRRSVIGGALSGQMSRIAELEADKERRDAARAARVQREQEREQERQEKRRVHAKAVAEYNTLPFYSRWFAAAPVCEEDLA